MDTIEIINYLENNNITAYHVNKETGISINTINDLIEGKRKPRRSTIDNLISFLQEHQKNMLGINQFKENIVNEPIQLYGNNISNKDLMTALKEIGNALIENAKTTTSLLIKTYDNTTEIISYTKDLDIENLKKVTFDASNR